MTRIGTVLRLLVCAFVFIVLIGPQWLSLRYGRGRVAAHLPTWFHKVFLILFGVRVSQSGTPPDTGEPALVLANHVSWLDILVLGSLRPLSFVAKSEISGWPVVGLLAKLQRTIFIDRTRRGATADVNAALAERLAAGDLIVLFAEGTTGDGLRLLPFRSSLVGAARGVIDSDGNDHTRLRLQPLAIAYPRRNGMPVTRSERPEIAWYGDMELAPHLSVFLASGPIDVQVVWGEPIPFEPGTDRKRATALAEASVRAALRRSRDGRLAALNGRREQAPELDLDAPGLPAI
ncbi:MAG: 1-acyl-sn-glycerol-3-phosphate acyltransferase [Methylobacterium sp.]|uniref:lysophospholipid acyltransferase family protein n=1 Tax=Methylobacterium sp. TaxID=409 RepID=UPI0025DC4089|nr:lysophospholipid acyltransferase family protein [Methylobacterium sp.]MBX9930790.1 1-acyl-sn-glycerol-3-phosphate acyltransferase [Methylobacterium sp.]